MQIFVNYYTAGFFIIYLLLAFVWPSIRVYRKTGINPVTFGRSDSAHDYIGRIFKLVCLLIPVTILCSWMGEPVYRFLLPADYLMIPYIQVSGMVICLLSFGWTVAAQVQMNSSWRIGIDTQHATKLVTNGLFAISRNPIFLGMAFTLLGFFLVLPNAITFFSMLAGYILIQVQIRLEETFLYEQHGEEYAHYKTRVNRLL